MEKGFSFILDFHHRHFRGVGDSLVRLDTHSVRRASRDISMLLINSEA